LLTAYTTLKCVARLSSVQCDHRTKYWAHLPQS